MTPESQWANGARAGSIGARKCHPRGCGRAQRVLYGSLAWKGGSWDANCHGILTDQQPPSSHPAAPRSAGRGRSRCQRSATRPACRSRRHGRYSL